jgi:hypothetical protein
MRYYVTAPDGEKGPYEEQQVREWLRAGTMPKDALVRGEDEPMGRPAHLVFPDMAGGSAFGPPGGMAFGAAPNVYAPPVAMGGSNEWVNANPGNFGLGFAFGFFCGCIALIVSYVSKDMGSETKRGVRIGFIVAFVIGAIVRVIAIAAR